MCDWVSWQSKGDDCTYLAVWLYRRQTLIQRPNKFEMSFFIFSVLYLNQ